MKKSEKRIAWIFTLFVFIIVLIIILPKTGDQKAAKQQEKEKLVKLEQEVKAISDDESVAKYISISKIEDDGSMFRITINLLFEPENYQQVQTWTDAVCESSKRILDSNNATRNISVWANRPTKGGQVVVYGRTFYSHNTGRTEFKNAKELNL